MKLNPNALATSGDYALDSRAGVQEVDDVMIENYVVSTGALAGTSAARFSVWLSEVFNDFNEDGDRTNGQVVAGALHDWRGGA